jgi:hypothetical protein
MCLMGFLRFGAGLSGLPRGKLWTMVSNFTSACCGSRLARGNAQGQTHSETSSNYLCTNDE